MYADAASRLHLEIKNAWAKASQGSEDGTRTRYRYSTIDEVQISAGHACFLFLSPRVGLAYAFRLG